MVESNEYPMGAQYNSMAPYNEYENMEREFALTISQTLSKDVIASSRNYVSEVEMDEDGMYDEYLVESETDFHRIFKDSGLHTPLQLIAILRDKLQEELDAADPNVGHNDLVSLIAECNGWIEDDFEVIH